MVLAALDVLGFRLGVVRIADEIAEELALEELLGVTEELVLEVLLATTEELVLEVVGLALTHEKVEVPSDEVAGTVLKDKVEVG